MIDVVTIQVQLEVKKWPVSKKRKRFWFFAFMKFFRIKTRQMFRKYGEECTNCYLVEQ